MRFSGKTLSITAAVLFGLVLQAGSCRAQQPEAGYWRAQSNTARGVTGDIQIGGSKLVINFASFTVADIVPVTPAAAQSLFSAEGEGSGNMYRVEIPGEKRFLHKNTLCGAEPVRYMATWVQGKVLNVAFFSGEKLPDMSPEALTNSTSLCGTYSYSR